MHGDFFLCAFDHSCQILGGGGISLVECLKSLLAPIYEVYWFPTAYIGMYFLFPFLNIVIDKIKDRIDKIFVLLTILFCLINFFFISSNFLYSNLIWFIYLYFVAAWNKYSNCRIKMRSKLIAICSIVCIWWSSVFFNLVGEHFAIEEIVHKAYYLSEIASPFIVCAGVGLFNYFNQLSIKYNKIINYIAGLTFPVYLLHDNGFFRNFMWIDIFKVEHFYGVPMWILLLHMLYVLVVLFLIAAVTELIRRYIEKAIFSKATGFISKIDRWYPV